MRLILLSLLLSWSAPATNCDGSELTDLDHYEVPVFRAVIVGWMPCSDEDLTPCPIYDRSMARLLTNDPELMLADPRLGEVLGYEWPEAIDAAGNSSAGCGT